MNRKILRRYIKMVFENQGGNAHVPTQLLPPDQESGVNSEEDNQEDIDEFSGCAGALGGGSGFGGYVAPLGSKKRKK